jgi:PhnB protein
MPKQVRPIPKGYPIVCPSLNQADSLATIAFCRKVFGGKLRSKMLGPGGRIMHAEVGIGDSVIMLSDAIREPARAASLFVYVADVDKTFARALKAGGTAEMPPRDMFWGDRVVRVSDPQGNVWVIATHREEVAPRELKKRLKALVASAGA